MQSFRLLRQIGSPICLLKITGGSGGEQGGAGSRVGVICMAREPVCVVSSCSAAWTERELAASLSNVRACQVLL